jgi:hypothetical protein
MTLGRSSWDPTWLGPRMTTLAILGSSIDGGPLKVSHFDPKSACTAHIWTQADPGSEGSGPSLASEGSLSSSVSRSNLNVGRTPQI